MNNRFILGLVTAAAIAAAVLSALQLTGAGSFTTMLALLTMGLLFSLSLLFKIRRYWVGMLLLGNLWSTNLNLPLFDNFTNGVVLQLVMIALAWAEKIILKQRSDYELNPGERAMLLFSCIMTLQLLIEHPGSARLGGAGGLGQMIYYVIAGWMYWGALTLARYDWGEVVATRWFLGASAWFCLSGVGLRILYGDDRPFFSLFWSAGFPLFSYLLGKAMQRWMSGRSTIFMVLAAALFILAASFYSAYRACPYIAIFMIFFVAIIFRLRYRFWFAIVTVMLGAFLVANTLPERAIPESFRRTLSTFRGIDPNNMLNRDPGEYGWDFEFRADLWNRAKQEIIHHPLTGGGWVFSFDEIIAAVAQNGVEGLKSSNALSGGYHNGLITLAAKSGLPAALSFLFAYLYLLFRFLRRIPENMDSRLLAAVLTGTLAGETVVFLTNGGGQQSVHIAVLLAVMSACVHRWKTKQTAPVVAPAPVSEPVRLALARTRGRLAVR